MRPLFLILLPYVFAGSIASFAGRALSDESPKPETQQSTSASGDEMSDGFVDRDGDGIADGKEHRFRKRSGRRGKEGQKQVKQKRNRNKGSRGNGSQSR